MASSEHTTTAPHPSSSEEPQPASQAQQSNAVEMTNLETPLKSEPSQPPTTATSNPSTAPQDAAQSTSGDAMVASNPSTAAAVPPVSTSIPAETSSTSQSAPAANNDTPITPAPMTRLDSIAIGPATDAATPASNSSSDNPVCTITLLLGNGARHPYKLDERYLAKRNVDVPGLTESGKKDPFSISVYTLKELILREWREEWEPQPASPSSIRLIHFGRLLDDKAPLKECRFNADTPNVVHMSIKPQKMIDDEEASKGKNLGRDRDGEERTAGCHCIIL